MTTKTSTETTETFPGICTFCKGAFPKKSMTQHLKTCPERAPLLKADKTKPAAQKTRLFQILIEGRYDPEYWMQVEVPAVEDLETLDLFLRDTWVECCDHLSAFRIGDTNYNSEEPYEDWSYEGAVVEGEIVAGEATDAEKKEEIAEEEDEDPIVAEDGTESVEILARNVAPIYPCTICQQPATFAEMGYGFLSPENVYCDKCTEEQFGGSDELLPIVNSPRVGVCGYTGND